jgi:hypothetical protein
MIVLKEIQSKVLAVLQSVAGIVQRRSVNKVIVCGNLGVDLCEVRVLAPLVSPVAWFARDMHLVRTVAFSPARHLSGFFSPGKANLRNAP